MQEPNTPIGETQDPSQTGGLVLSSPGESGLTLAAAEAEIATMRQMMEVLFSRVESLQQNQAIQFSGVNDRLDAVELELPLIQEQSALRMRDLETRMNSGIEDAARAIAEQVAAGLQDEVTGKFGSLSAQLENQRVEIDEMRESKKLAESRLTRTLQDIERLCGTLAPASFPVSIPAEAQRMVPETSASPFRSRIAEHIRKAAVEAAPDESNPLVAEAPLKKPSPDAPSTAPESEPAPASALPAFKPPVSQPAITPAFEPRARIAARSSAATSPAPAPAAASRATHPETPSPGFDDWKRRFMQSGDPLVPSLGGEHEKKGPIIVCPRCYSERTRPATPTKMDGILRLAGLHPHRCRACAYRFHKRGVGGDTSGDPDNTDSRTEEPLGAR